MQRSKIRVSVIQSLLWVLIVTELVVSATYTTATCTYHNFNIYVTYFVNIHR